jgi:GntR family transcriptional regulator
MEAFDVTSAPFLPPDRDRPEPLWFQVEQVVRQMINSGEWQVGVQLPAEDRLCALFGVSRITLRHALRNLEDSGLLRREHGRGTFVRNTTLVAGTRELTSFTHEMDVIGVRASSRLLECSLSTATSQAASALEIEEGDPVVRIRRLRLGNDQPIGIQTAQLSGARAPDFLDTGMLQGSLYEALRQRYGIVPVTASEVYRVAAVGAEDAALLDLAPGSPAFVVERITADDNGPFEFTVSVMRGDRYEIRSTLRAGRPSANPKT